MEKKEKMDSTMECTNFYLYILRGTFKNTRFLKKQTVNKNYKLVILITLVVLKLKKWNLHGKLF